MQSDMTELTSDEVTDARRILDERILKAKQQLDGVCRVILELITIDSRDSDLMAKDTKDGFHLAMVVVELEKNNLQKELDELEKTKTIFDSILGEEK